MVIFFALILLVTYIIIQYNVSRLFEKIAFDKGYDESAHPFAMCFWLGIVGYIYVAAMPKLTADEIAKKQEISNTEPNDDEYQKDDKIYEQAVKKIDKGNTYSSIGFYIEDIELLNTIPNHKNSNELIDYCKKKIQELEK